MSAPPLSKRRPSSSSRCARRRPLEVGPVAELRDGDPAVRSDRPDDEPAQAAAVWLSAAGLGPWTRSTKIATKASLTWAHFAGTVLGVGGGTTPRPWVGERSAFLRDWRLCSARFPAGSRSTTIRGGSTSRPFIDTWRASRTGRPGGRSRLWNDGSAKPLGSWGSTTTVPSSGSRGPYRTVSPSPTSQTSTSCRGTAAQGLGEELVREIVERGEARNVRWLLHTRDAHALYAKVGFGRPGERLMERPIGG